MMKKLILILLFQSVALGQVSLDLEKARKIELLKSTREDVQKIFGGIKSELRKFHRQRFFTSSSIIDVSYSPGLCKDENDLWNVPEWVVIEVFIAPGKGINPKELGLNLSEYKKTNSFDVIGGGLYGDDAKGIEFDIMSEKVTNITLYPPAKYNYLKCE